MKRARRYSLLLFVSPRTYVRPMLHRTNADWHANVLTIPSPSLHLLMRPVQCGTTLFIASYTSSDTTWMWCELFHTISGYQGYCCSGLVRPLPMANPDSGSGCVPSLASWFPLKIRCEMAGT
jgi:hypothetical protein